MALVRNHVGHQTSHPLEVIFHFRSELLGGDRTNTIGTTQARDPESVKESAQKNGMVVGSKAAVKSSMTNPTTQPRSTAHRMSLWTLISAVSVILPVCGLKLVV